MVPSDKALFIIYGKGLIIYGLIDLNNLSGIESTSLFEFLRLLIIFKHSSWLTVKKRMALCDYVDGLEWDRYEQVFVDLVFFLLSHCLKIGHKSRVGIDVIYTPVYVNLLHFSLTHFKR